MPSAARPGARWRDGSRTRSRTRSRRSSCRPSSCGAQLLRGLDTEHARILERATHTIVQQVDAIKQMVDAFSEYARSPEVQLARFSLNQLAAEMVELYRLQDPGIDIDVELDPQLGEIEADRGRVRQILANLLSNAIEALAGVTGAAIGVRTRWLLAGQSAQAEITVSDNGPGFREDILSRAFDPYVTSKARGTGLGWRSCAASSRSTAAGSARRIWSPAGRGCAYCCRPASSGAPSRGGSGHECEPDSGGG